MWESRKILVVDDEERIRRIYSQVLSLEGFEVMEASNATEATRILISRSPDLVLLDILMPQIDGKLMYEVIREYDAGLKVIVASVYSVEEQKRHIAGAAEYYDKSEGIDVFLQKIREVLKDEPTPQDSNCRR